MTSPRTALLGQALALAYFTVGWNVVEGAIGLWAAADAGSDVLLGFGLDSAIESIAGLVLIWRLNAERRDPGRASEVEEKALRVIGVTFILLAVFVTYQSLAALVKNEHPDASIVGIILTFASMVVMPALARRKQSVGREMGSRAVLADAAQTWACAYLSGIVMIGLILNAAFGWWWADPVAALAVVVFLLREGSEALRGEHEEHH